MAINIIQGTDREFTLRIERESTKEPVDLTGLATDQLELMLPGEDADLALTLTPNVNGSKLEVISALGGKIKATLSDIDTALLKAGTNLNMELTIKAGAGPDYDISKVQFNGSLTVLKSLFE